ncbi:MAG TPA: DAK2 domain-containing protein [Streptosporangiaceae bacterium]|nr:DAK2 domain-containing protein [Streptosporangiaceae bacterium]
MSALAEVMKGVAADMAARHDELNRLDAAAGDGDLGNTVAIAAQAVRAAVDGSDDADPAALLRRCGTDVATAAPSTTGTLTARGLLGAARAIGAATGEPPVRLLYLGFAAALAAIQSAGKAAPGEKTMIDALAPAVAALSDHADAGAQLPDALSAAAAAASLGADQTRDMTAKAGRARWLAERSQGAEDAGARFVALVLESAASRAHER